MKVIKPVTVTDAVLISSTAPETDYAAWAAGTAYSVGNRVIRTSTHRIYERMVAGTTATAPELDSVNWIDIAPTNRWAMFDGEVSTQTALASPLTVVIKPGLVNGLALFGLAGTTLVVTVRDEPRLVSCMEKIVWSTVGLKNQSQVPVELSSSTRPPVKTALKLP